jgi:hypothetical protein
VKAALVTPLFVTCTAAEAGSAPRGFRLFTCMGLMS